MKNLSDILTKSASLFGNKTALIFKDRSFSYTELNSLSNRLASSLSHNIGPGDKVTLYGENSWEWIVSYYGILKTGAAVNPINVMLTPEEVSYIVKDCGAKAIIASQSKGTPLLALKGKMEIDLLILYGDTIPETATPFTELVAQGKDDFPSVELPTETLSTICYTSGTTGNPKGAMLSHRSVITNCLMTAQMHGRNSQDVVVSALPCPHVYGNIVFNSTFYKGGTLIMHPVFDVQAVFDSINQYQATMFEGVPTMYMYMLDHPDLSTVDFSHMRICTVGGQTMPSSKMIAVENITKCPLIELWGMTEIGGLGTTFAHDGEYKHGSIGVALPYTRTKIVSVDNADQELVTGEVGELMISGPLVMQGYYNNEQATKETITADGWLHSGDLAKMDENNCIYLVDRKKDLIITAGFNIYPAELERVIAGHPDVAMVAVGPVLDDIKGELAKAYIVAKQNTRPTEESIITFCRKHLAAYKVPRIVQFVEDLPKTSSGKVMRRQLHTLD